MYPRLFGVEWLDTFTILVAVGIIACLILFRINCTKLGVSARVYNYYITTGVIAIAGGFLFAFAFQQMYNGIEAAITKEPFEAGGITFLGGLIGAVLIFVLIPALHGDAEIKENFWKAANLAMPSILLAHAVGRLGCFCAGCCHGRETTSPLGIFFPDFDKSFNVIGYTKYYPTQLYEALFLFAMFAVSMLLIYRYKKINIQLPFYCFSYSVFRFIIEFLRGDARGTFIPGISPSQFQSILMFLIATLVCVLVFRFKVQPFQTAAKKRREKDAAKAADAVKTAEAANNEISETAEPKSANNE